MTDTLPLDFHGDWGGESPTTWAQHEQWDVQEANKPVDARFNVPTLIELDEHVSLDDVRHAVTALIERHESLRTRYVPGPDNIPVQHVARSGQAALHVFTAEDGSYAEAARFRDRLTGQRFETESEWPARFGVVMRGGRPQWLVGAASHVTVDMAGAQVLRRDLRALLDPTGPSLPPTPLQPRHQAEFEGSERGRSVLKRSLTAWRTGLERVPALPLRQQPDDPAEPEFPAMILRAKGVGRHLAPLVESIDARLSAACVAACMASMSKVLGAERFPLKVSCSNRTKDKDDFAGMIAQQGLIPVESLAMPFPELVRRAWTGIIGANRTSRYDSLALRAMAAEHFGDGPVIDHWINYVQVDPAADLLTAHPDLADGERVCFADDPVPFTTLRFGWYVVSNGTDVHLRVFGDRRFLPRTTMTELLETAYGILRQGAL